MVVTMVVSIFLCCVILTLQHKRGKLKHLPMKSQFLMFPHATASQKLHTTFCRGHHFGNKWSELAKVVGLQALDFDGQLKKELNHDSPKHVMALLESNRKCNTHMTWLL
jgi:hypothetical protein